MQNVFKAVKAWAKENAPVLAYFLFAILIEMTAVFVVEGTPFLTRPFLSIGVLLIVCGVLLLIKSNRARIITCTAMLLLQAVLDLVFSVIYDMTDQYFDLGMLSLRNDAFAILESLPVDFVTFYVGLFLSVMFLVFGLRFAYYKARPAAKKHSVFFYVGLILAGVATLGISFVSYYPRTSKDKYDEMVDGRSQSAYSAYGMIGNLVGEVGNAIFQDTSTLDGKEIDSFIYDKVSTPTEYFGVAKDKNLVVILAESLEWYVFLRGGADNGNQQGEYPNALDIPQEVLAQLYPNLTEYYNESVVMTNYHSREKTDIAEVLSILGSYPTGSYINYEYAKNTVPYTLPNILKAQDGENITIRSFHNGFKSYYNREEAHPMFGFESSPLVCPIDMHDMEQMSKDSGLNTFKDYNGDGDRNLDSEMVATAKDLMFPKDKRFCTYITTITMHGMFYDRENLRPENNTKLAEKLAILQAYKPTDVTAPDYDNAMALYYYMTTGLEFDYMLQLMKEDLVAKGLWDKTVITMYADHNVYYQGLSSYVKGIDDYDSDPEMKFTDLYNVPLLIRDADLIKKLEEKGVNRKIDKFVCTADIVPTLLDLLGIKYFENMYYGHSIFAKEQSVLYSRAYDIFLSDGIVRRSVKGEFYEYDGLTENGARVADTVSAFEREGKSLVEKIKYCDYIFRQNHFGYEDNYKRFREEMKKINA